MNWQTNFVGALMLKHDTFVELRERSDVFLRGFVVLLFAALVAGAFASLSNAIGTVTPLVTKDQVLAQANAIFESADFGPPEIKTQIQPYVTEIASMMYELENLPPRAGESVRPVVAFLNFVGGTLATPFRWEWIGWTLFAGLLFQFSARLLGGQASMAQMLGLTTLAVAPQIFSSVTSLLTLIGTVSGVGLLASASGVVGFGIAVWSAAVYVKATSVAQNFSMGRAVGAIALGGGILAGMLIVLALVVSFMFAGIIAAFASR